MNHSVARPMYSKAAGTITVRAEIGDHAALSGLKCLAGICPDHWLGWSGGGVVKKVDVSLTRKTGRKRA